jgi:ribonuclease G
MAGAGGHGPAGALGRPFPATCRKRNHMAKNTLVISVDLRETRVALIEDGIIAELHIERGGTKSSTVGNVYLGKVTRVLPGLQAAFIDIGQERAAFLHVEYLIRPDDFETYLQGAHKKKSATNLANDGAEETADDDATEAPSGVSLPPALASTLALPDDRDSDSSLDPDDELPASDREAEHVDLASESSHDLSESAAPRSHSNDVADAVDAASPSKYVHGASNFVTDADATAPHAPITELFASTPSVRDVTEANADGAEAFIDDSSHVSDRDSDDSDAPASTDDDHEGDSSNVNVESLAPASGGTRRAEKPRSDVYDLPGFTIEGESDLPGFTISNPGDPVPRAPLPQREERSGGRRRRRGRRGADGPRPAGGTADTRVQGSQDPRRGGPRDAPRDGARQNRGRGGPSIAPPIKTNRISKTTPIREVVQEGQEVVVQVSKDPIGTKGARCTSHISLPGRYVVYLPTVEHVGVSKRIGSDKERSRLREAIDNVKPPTGGLIVRTLAEGLTKKQLKQDVGYLVRLWEEVAKKREGNKAPALLTSELDIVLKVARDLFTDEVDEVVIDDKHQYERLCRFVEMFAPDRVKDVTLYTGDEPVFDEYGIEEEIQRALARKVPLPSGGHLIIDQAEALAAIDVNTGRFVGKGSKDMEETILKTNLEAVHEIAYQLRFRNIGGLIILDLIDMEKSSNREKVRRTLEELLEKDKAKTSLNRISDLGLIEMTRKRTRESLGRMLHEPCFYCDGTGQVQSKETVAYEILREIKRKRRTLPGYGVVVTAHPSVIDLLQGAEKATILEAENKYMRKITLMARKDYHVEQFDIVGK